MPTDGYRARAERHRPPTIEEQIAKLARDGMSVHNIAAILKLDPTFVARALIRQSLAGTRR